MRTSAEVADSDSSAAMFRLLARFLHGRGARDVIVTQVHDVDNRLRSRR